MLCGIRVVFNLLDDVFALVRCQRRSENWQLLMGFQSPEALGCFQHAGRAPQRRWQFEAGDGQYLVEPFRSWLNSASTRRQSAIVQLLLRSSGGGFI
jgi:hypothetical protein